MKICVTGGAGYIGSHVCKALANEGHEVIVYDNLSTGHRNFVRWGDFVHGDIRDTQRLRACFARYKPDAVMHFAAFIEVGESVLNPGKYFNNNVTGTLSLLEAMRDENIGSIVVSSTCAVYGKPKSVPITEDFPTHPINPYGEAKLFMEQMIRDFAVAHDLKWMSLRYFNAAGGSPEGEIGELHEPESHLIPRVIFAALGRLPQVDIFGNDYPTPDGTCLRDYIHVDDLATAHIRSVKHLLDNGESMALNLGSGQAYSVREIIRGVERISGKPVPIREQPNRPGDSPRLVANASLAEKVLGWKAHRNLDEILTNAWNFLEKY